MHTISTIAGLVDGTIEGDGSTVITGVGSSDTAGVGEITFAEKEANLRAAELTRASAVLVPQNFGPSSKALIRVKNPRVAIAKILALFFPAESYPAGVHSSAAVDPTAVIDPSAYVGPHCIIGPGAQIGARAALLGGNHVGRDSRIGEGTVLHPNVVLYAKSEIGARGIIHAGSVIGSDGYGYVFDAGRHHKVLQVGRVVIGDDVEIGANVAIDRGALGATSIGNGTKIDNLVHIAHNVTIGEHCLVMGQVGFAGSTRLGNYVVVASQSGIAGHLKIGNQATIGAKSGVMRDIPDKETVLGYPAAPDKQAKRQWVAMAMLPDLIKRLRALEDR